MFPILPTDRMFLDSPDPGTDCICSRCELPIIDEVPIRITMDDSSKNLRYHSEYRYHHQCVGIEMAETIDFDDINEEFEIE